MSTPAQIKASLLLAVPLEQLRQSAANLARLHLGPNRERDVEAFTADMLEAWRRVAAGGATVLTLLPEGIEPGAAKAIQAAVAELMTITMATFVASSARALKMGINHAGPARGAN